MTKRQLVLIAIGAVAVLNVQMSTAETDYEALLALRTSDGFERALEQAHQKISADPNDGRAWAVAALAYANGVDFMAMEPSEARTGKERALAEALRLAADDAYARAAYGLIQQSTDPDAAERRLLECIADTPDFVECHNLYGDFLRKASRSEEAELVYKAALERWPSDGELLVSYALQLQETGRADQAIELLETLVVEQPSFPRGHWHLGAMLFETGGDLERSRRAVTRALELDPHIWNGDLLLRLLDDATR